MCEYVTNQVIFNTRKSFLKDCQPFGNEKLGTFEDGDI